MAIDPRAFAIATTFQYYAVRELRLTYMPQVGTSSTAAMSMLCLAISQDAEEHLDVPEPTQTQLLEQNVAMACPTWQTFTLEYKHTGVKLWRVNPEAEGSLDETVQCLLGGVLSVRDPGTEQGPKLGSLFCEAVMDLYEPQPIEGAGSFTVSLPSHEVNPGSGDGLYVGDGYYDGSQYPADYNAFVSGGGPTPFHPSAEAGPLAFSVEEKGEFTLVARTGARARGREQRVAQLESELRKELSSLRQAKDELRSAAAGVQAFANATGVGAS